jgi:hypothetical protein
MERISNALRRSLYRLPLIASTAVMALVWSAMFTSVLLIAVHDLAIFWGVFLVSAVLFWLSTSVMLKRRGSSLLRSVDSKNDSASCEPQ